MSTFLPIASKKQGTPELYNIFKIEDQEIPNVLAFLREDTLEALKNKLSSCESAEDSFKKMESLRDTWRDLLVDAIYFLRINDSRENHFFEERNEKTQKTTMRTKGVADSIRSGVYGIEELVEYFSQFSDFESTLYGADKYYRDHVVHPINVWLIGLHVIQTHGGRFKLRAMDEMSIENCPCAKAEWFPDIAVRSKGSATGDGQPSDQKTNPVPTKCCLSIGELAAMWTVIALTHDLGYPLEKVEKVNDKLERMLSKFGKIGFSRFRFNFEIQHDHLVRFLLNLISSIAKPVKDGDKENYHHWRTHIRTKYYSKFSKSWEMFDHGIVSSLILLKSLTFFIESDFCNNYKEPIKREDARQFAIRSEILHSMASHTTAKIYHLSPDNLPFLLILCDDLQEWSRPTLGDMKIGIKGNAEEVVLEKFEITDNRWSIHCQIKYEKCDYNVQQDHAIRVFKVWLERFRPALDDEKRSINFSWKMNFGDNAAWEFKLNTSQQKIFEIFEFKRPKESDPHSRETFDFHKLEEESKREKR